MYELPHRQVHLDFHTSEQIPGVGAKFDAHEFVTRLQEAHVNSVTCFSRCHHGMIYHDTKFTEARHPHLTCNLLGEQIEACHEADIRVPVYITVGWDELQTRLHPEWLERDPQGRPRGAPPLKPGWHKLCFNTPYVDYVWEQAAEVLGMFEVDGIFFDIINQGPCLCTHCLEGMKAAGLSPHVEQDRAQFAAQVVAQFKRRFSEAVRQISPDCRIFYNAGHVGPDIRRTLDTYTHLELESLPSGGWGYLHFPVTARFARTLGVDILGMTGKFHKSWGDFNSLKNRAALEYECFTMLAEGARCSVGDQLHPSGHLDAATYQLIGSVYAQVEAKEPWCRGAEPLAEIGIFTPEAIGQEDSRVDSAAAGALRMLREGHYQCDIVDGESDWARYEVIILPDKIVLDEDLAGNLRSYLRNGGGLILSYESGLNPDKTAFALSELGREYLGLAGYATEFIEAREAIARGIPSTQHVLYERGLDVRGTREAEVLADIWRPYFDRTYAHFCSHSHTPVAEKTDRPAVFQLGNVIYFTHPIFGLYGRHGARVYRQLVLNCLQRLLPEPLVRANLPTTAQVTVLRQEAECRTVVHLLHYIPERRHPSFDTVEDIIPLYDAELHVRGSKPSNVYLAPSREPLDWRQEGSYVRVTVPELRGHAMIVLEE